MLRNDMLGKSFHVTNHAIDRWNERGTSDDMSAVFRRALPFGVQKGPCLMLMDGEVVFVTSCSENGGRAITTVLTREQAMANMQRILPASVLARRPSLQAVASTTPTDEQREPDKLTDPVEPIAAPTIPDGQIVGTVDLPPIPDINAVCQSSLAKMSSLTLDDLKEVVRKIDDFMRDYKGRITKAQRAQIGVAQSKLQKQLGEVRLRYHANLMETRYRFTKQACRQLLGEEKAMEIFLLANELEKESCKAAVA